MTERELVERESRCWRLAHGWESCDAPFCDCAKDSTLPKVYRAMRSSAAIGGSDGQGFAMKYDAWRKLGVLTSDLRTLNIDGLDDPDMAIPGIAFQKPVIEDYRGSPVIKRFDNLGFITFDPKRMMWDVQIENTEREFIDMEVACRYLWDTHYKEELDATRFLLIAVDRDGEIVLKRKCVSERHMLEVAVNELPDVDEPAYAKENLEADLSKPGARFHEFIGGHFAAFPIEDE